MASPPKEDENNNTTDLPVTRQEHTLAPFLKSLGIEEDDRHNYFDPARFVSSRAPKRSWDEYTLKDFEIGKPLGEGRYGHVYLARTTDTRFIVALKVLHVKEIEVDGVQELVNRETLIHIKLSHPNILEMHGYFRDKDKIAYVLEYAPGGDLLNHLMSQPENRFENAKAALYIKHVLSALQYLHCRKILHRDIKPENILIGYNEELKLADFGWAIQCRSRNERRKTLCGTKDYMAPEMIHRKPYDDKADLWCFGTLAYELLVGKVPFEWKEKKHDSGHLFLPDTIQPAAADFISKLLAKDPEQRMSLGQAKTHPWLREALPDTKKLLPEFQELENAVDMEDLANVYESVAISALRQSMGAASSSAASSSASSLTPTVKTKKSRLLSFCTSKQHSFE